MNTTDLRRLLKCDKVLNKFDITVCAVDQLPMKINFPCGFIINTDPITRKGSHWVAVFFYSASKCEFFDSMGQNPKFYNAYFENFIYKFCTNFTYNHKPIQMRYSNICGIYCIMFLMYCCKAKRMNIFIEQFGSNRSLNDIILMNMYRHYLRRCINRNVNVIVPPKVKRF